MKRNTTKPVRISYICVVCGEPVVTRETLCDACETRERELEAHAQALRDRDRDVTGYYE